MTRTIKLVAALAGIGLAGIGGWSWAIAWAPPTSRYAFQGIDIDDRGGVLDWGTVRAAGAEFAYLVATAGVDRRAPAFEENWTAIADAGLRRGAVHRYSLCRPAVDQANAFNTVVPRDDAALPAAVDLAFDDACDARPDRSILVGEIARFVTMVEAHTGKPMLLRIDARVESAYDLSAALPRPIWATGNFFAPGYAARPWRMWRASDLRRINGIDGAVNWNVVAP